MSRFGPTRGEWKFRLAFSLGGLGLLAGGLFYRRDADFGPGAWEAILISLAFFGGTALWSIRALMGRDE